MKIAIIVSKNDIAGLNIKNQLLDLFDFNILSNLNDIETYGLKYIKHNVKIYIIPEDTVYFEYPEKQIEADLFIFATKHQSQSGEKTLSIHVPGNYGQPDFGGLKEQLCICPATFIKDTFRNLNELGKNFNLSITLEATHHGPISKKPVFFIEIGSNEEQWENVLAGKIIANTIMKTISNLSNNNNHNNNYKTAIAFGGSHYCSGFNKIELLYDVAISHVCPKYIVDNINSSMVTQMIDKTSEKVDFALLDWKGLNSIERLRIIEILKQLEIPWKKTKEIKSV